METELDADVDDVSVFVALPASWEADLRREFRTLLDEAGGCRGEVLDSSSPDEDNALFEPISLGLAAVWLGELIVTAAASYLIPLAIERVFRRQSARSDGVVRARLVTLNGTVLELDSSDPDGLAQSLATLDSLLPARSKR